MTLFQHAIDVTHTTYLAEHNPGDALLENTRKFTRRYSPFQGVSPDPSRLESPYTPISSSRLQRLRSAVGNHAESLTTMPPWPRLSHPVILAADPAKTTEAIQQFQTALKINPNYEEAHYNAGVALSNSPHRLCQSIAPFEAADKIHRDPRILDFEEA